MTFQYFSDAFFEGCKGTFLSVTRNRYSLFDTTSCPVLAKQAHLILKGNNHRYAASSTPHMLDGLRAVTQIRSVSAQSPHTEEINGYNHVPKNNNYACTFCSFLQNVMAKCYWCYFSVFATTYPKYNSLTQHVAAQVIHTSKCISM